MTDTRPTTRVTLLTQADCAGCEHAKKVLAGLGDRHRLEVTELSITSPQGRALAREHNLVFPPGILLDGVPLGYGRLSRRRLLRALDARTSERPQVEGD